MSKELEDAKARLASEINSDAENKDNDFVSWAFQNGVLLSSNQAKALLSELNRTCEWYNTGNAHRPAYDTGCKTKLDAFKEKCNTRYNNNDFKYCPQCGGLIEVHNVQN